jgi:ABC-type lipoprotein release transport system permease subunit
MILLDIFNAAIAVICFSLALFQLIVSISANIRDNMWELGVLRAMGMTKAEVVRITIYESMANSLSSITLGFLIGLIIAVTLVG